MPHLYPFIVNDPGEGSQAKRRSQAVILDHLTPPLGRAGLHGALQRLEVLLDEYWEACQLGSERAGPLRQTLAKQLESMELPLGSAAELDSRLDAADGYLCELKEAQIRLGLHTFGTLPEPGRLAELLLCLARCPLAGQPGLTQALAQDLQLSFDPWGDEDSTPLGQADQQRLQGAFGGELPRMVGDGVALLEAQALTLVEQELAGVQQSQDQPSPSPGPRLQQALMHLRQALMPPLLACGRAEREAFLRGLEGERIAAGPSGAPTRGRPDLLEALDARGGVLGAMETMYQRSQIQEESLFYEERKHNGELPIIGVNTFLPESDEGMVQETKLIRSSEDEKQSQVDAVADVRIDVVGVLRPVSGPARIEHLVSVAA
jgi:cobaltochelatase CobN